MEKLFYESRPFIYLLLAIYALTNYRGGVVLKSSGTILLLSALLVFYWRIRFRAMGHARSRHNYD